MYNADSNRYDGRMPYVRTGKSGVLLPAISLGMWHNFGDVDDFDTGKKVLHYAFDNGITHFDLANNYGPSYGSAELTMGKMMRTSFAPYRDEMFISTKAGYDMWKGPYGNWGSRKYLTASLDQSLKRMNLDYVDIFYSHRFDPETPVEETMQALVDAVRAGKALYAGISNYPAEAAAKAYEYLAAHDTPCLLYQGKYSILVRNPEEEILRQAKEAGSGFIAFSPLAQGLLTGKYLNGVPKDSRIDRGHNLSRADLTPDVLNRISQLSELASKRGQTLAQMSISWLLHSEYVTSVLIGARSVEQLASNLKALENTSFSEEELKLI